MSLAPKKRIPSSHKCRSIADNRNVDFSLVVPMRWWREERAPKAKHDRLKDGSKPFRPQRRPSASEINTIVYPKIKTVGALTFRETPLKINATVAYPTLPDLGNDTPRSKPRHGVLRRSTKNREAVKNVTWASDVPSTSELLPKQVPNLKLRKIKKTKKWEHPTSPIATRTRAATAAAAAEAKRNARTKKDAEIKVKNARRGKASGSRSKSKGKK